MERHGLKKGQLVISEEMLTKVITGYTREAGVRRLEQVLAKLCRKAARHIADGGRRLTVSNKNLEDLLGVAPFKKDVVTGKDEVGIVNGLAWTSVGGDTLQIEVNVMPGKGVLQMTGQMGDVMKESAQIALTYVREHRPDVLQEQRPAHPLP